MVLQEAGARSHQVAQRAGRRLRRGLGRSPWASSSRASSAVALHCTTRFENAHRTVLREVLYRHHPWFGLRVHVHGAVVKADDVVFRCTLDGSRTDRWLELPAWMFDRTACADDQLLTARPFVSVDALAALSALLGLTLKDRTPSSNAPLSGACRASHDQNRGEAHVTRDGGAAKPIQAQSATAGTNGSVYGRPAGRRHRRACMARTAAGSASGGDRPDEVADPSPYSAGGDCALEGGRS